MRRKESIGIAATREADAGTRFHRRRFDHVEQRTQPPRQPSDRPAKSPVSDENAQAVPKDTAQRVGQRRRREPMTQECTRRSLSDSRRRSWRQRLLTAVARVKREAPASRLCHPQVDNGRNGQPRLVVDQLVGIGIGSARAGLNRDDTGVARSLLVSILARRSRMCLLRAARPTGIAGGSTRIVGRFFARLRLQPHDFEIGHGHGTGRPGATAVARQLLQRRTAALAAGPTRTSSGIQFGTAAENVERDTDRRQDKPHQHEPAQSHLASASVPANWPGC